MRNKAQFSIRPALALLLLFIQTLAIPFQIDSWPISSMPMFSGSPNEKSPTAFAVVLVFKNNKQIEISRSHYKLPLFLYEHSVTNSLPLDYYLKQLPFPKLANLEPDRLEVVKITVDLYLKNERREVIYRLPLI